MPDWGDQTPRLIIVGLAPGLKGANRTGRPFTGDYAGDLLYATLLKFGLATGEYEQTPDDSLHAQGRADRQRGALRAAAEQADAAEIKTCRQFLVRRLVAHRSRRPTSRSAGSRMTRC